MEKALTLTRAMAQVSTRKQIARAQVNSQLAVVEEGMNTLRNCVKQGGTLSVAASVLVKHAVKLFVFASRESELRALEDQLVGRTR